MKYKDSLFSWTCVIQMPGHWKKSRGHSDPYKYCRRQLIPPSPIQSGQVQGQAEEIVWSGQWQWHV
jgi:hypothetical protein